MVRIVVKKSDEKTGDKDTDEAIDLIGNGGKGLTHEKMVEIMTAMPETMNPAGMVTLFVNIMANFNFLPQSPAVLALTAKALLEMKEQIPEAFEDGGIERMKMKAVMDNLEDIKVVMRKSKPKN